MSTCDLFQTLCKGKERGKLLLRDSFYTVKKLYPLIVLNLGLKKTFIIEEKITSFQKTVTYFHLILTSSYIDLKTFPYYIYYMNK
jgi:hypothetical protein